MHDHRLILHPEERDIIVLDETPLELQRAAGGVDAEHPELTHRPPHAVPAIRAAQIAAALVKAVNNVALGGAGDGYLKVVEVGGVRRVDKRREDRVDVGLVGRPGAELHLRAAAVDESIDDGT